MNHYQILSLPINATQREIYRSFSNKIDYSKSFSEQLAIIDAFIVLSDINLRKKYDLSIGLNYDEDAPQYLYSYFENGTGFFDIDGHFAGSKELTQFLIARKGNEIRCSDNVGNYYNEAEIYQEMGSLQLKNIPLQASKFDVANLSELEKFEIFKKIYDSYKKGFIFSGSFVTYASDNQFNGLPIEEAARLASQKILNYNRGVCTHFAALLYQELKTLGIEVYYIRLILSKWTHHVVLYRIENEWYIGDLTNEYLNGRAGYNINTDDYGSIKLIDFLSQNMQLLDLAYMPNIFGESLMNTDVVTLRNFFELRNKNEYKKL